MSTYKWTARIVGALYLAGMVVGIGGNIMIQSIITKPDHLSNVAANGMLLAIGAILILLAGVWDAAHGILMFPILKQRGERIAVGYLSYRLIDGAFVGLWSLFLLLQIPLSREYIKAGATDTTYLQALSAISVQASLYSYQIAMVFVGLAGLTLCYALYKAKLVPGWLAVWGLVGYVIHFAGAGMEIMGFNVGLVPVIPGGLWELFIGVWLIAKGFNTAAFVPVSTQKNAIATDQMRLSQA